MAGAGADFVFIHGRLGFIWRAVRRSAFSSIFYASSHFPSLESFFFA
jgi:hypothetical protein